MRTTLNIKEELLEEAKKLSGAKTKKKNDRNSAFFFTIRVS